MFKKPRPLCPCMWNEPSVKRLARLPSLYATENTPWEQTVIHEHFFLGGSDWYAAEYDPADRLFFGYAILNNDLDNSEWGYFSYDELREINIRGLQIDRDLHWRVRPAGEVERIVQGHRGRGGRQDS